jgi:hypothetical protein
MIKNSMRKTFVLIAACLMSMLASAQVLEIVSTQQLSTPADVDRRVAGFNPVGDYIFLTDGGNGGLVSYNLTTHSTTTIS